MEFWERADDCKDAKFHHLEALDRFCDSREDLVLNTTLWQQHTAMETNMFPCKCTYTNV